MVSSTRIGIIVVSYGHQDYIDNIASILGPQKINGDSLVIVDNHPNRKAAKVAMINKYVDNVIEAENGGFAAGITLGVDSIINKVDYLFFLNPDTIPSSDLLRKIRKAVSSTDYAAYMPVLMLPSGKINSAGNVVHTSGLSWCDHYEDTPNFTGGVVSISTLSGACMIIRKDWWKRVGGMDSYYFLYYEDTDISARIKLNGGKLGLITDARVIHDYDYAKGSHKWFYLERNRPLLILRTWPTAVIIVLLPELLVVEVGLWLVAIVERRLILKVKSTLSFLRIAPQALFDRMRIQSNRKTSSYDFLLDLKAELDTPALGAIGRNKIINRSLVIYRGLSLWALNPRLNNN